MKDKILLVWLAWLPVLLFAQERAPEINTDLEVGQEFHFGKTSVKFVKVLSDSRCPKQVACMWAGEAKVLLGITTRGVYTEKEVVVSDRGAEMAFENDLQLLVSHLRPYPETAKGIRPKEYYLSIATVPSCDD